MNDPGYRVIGRHVPRADAWEKVRGRPIYAGEPVLAADRIRFQGEPVVAIAAETPEVADRATELVEVDYEELPGVFDPLDALRPGAALVHGDGNVLRRWR